MAITAPAWLLQDLQPGTPRLSPESSIRRPKQPDSILAVPMYKSGSRSWRSCRTNGFTNPGAAPRRSWRPPGCNWAPVIRDRSDHKSARRGAGGVETSSLRKATMMHAKVNPSPQAFNGSTQSFNGSTQPLNGSAEAFDGRRDSTRPIRALSRGLDGL